MTPPSPKTTAVAGVELGRSAFSDRLFAAASIPMVILELETGSVLQFNPAAAVLLRVAGVALEGAFFCDLFREENRERLREAVATARMTGSASLAGCRVVSESVDLAVRFSSFRAGAELYLLVHLTPQSAYPVLRAGKPDVGQFVFDSVAHASFGFLMTDGEFEVVYANDAFARMVGLATADAAAGAPLKRWLEFSDTDLMRLRDQMSRREAVTSLTTTLVAEDQDARQVEVSAVAVPHPSKPCWGFCVGAIPKLN